MLRALEMVLRPAGRRVFEDPIARHCVSPLWRVFLKTGPVTALLLQAHERRYRGMICEVCARSRYAQESLARLIGEGVRQVVVLGAGYDATAWLPDLPADLMVFEVDHPDTQRLKRERLARAGVEVPAQAVFVPLDLAGRRLQAALEEAGHDARRRSLVTLLGLLPYLTPQQVNALFCDMGRTFAPGSEVIYTYFSRRAIDPHSAPLAARRMARRLARAGEPYLSGADAHEMARLADVAGLDQVETLDGAALTARYFACRGDSRIVADWINLSRARKR